MALGIKADMVNADCVHIRWLDNLCPVDTFDRLYELRIVCL